MPLVQLGKVTGWLVRRKQAIKAYKPYLSKQLLQSYSEAHWATLLHFNYIMDYFNIQQIILHSDLSMSYLT